MMAQVLRNFPYTALTCFGMLIFISVFIGALLWVFRRGSEDFYRLASQLPLEPPHVPSHTKEVIGS